MRVARKHVTDSYSNANGNGNSSGNNGEATLCLPRQRGWADCGPACARALLQWYGIAATEQEVEAALPISSDGVSAASLVQLFLDRGLDSWGSIAGAGDLSQVEPPAILHWKSGHFVILREKRTDTVVVLDPLRERPVTLNWQELAAISSGLAIHVLRMRAKNA